MGKDRDNSFSNKIINFHKQEVVLGKQMWEQFAQRTDWNSRFFPPLEILDIIIVIFTWFFLPQFQATIQCTSIEAWVLWSEYHLSWWKLTCH